MLLISQLLQDNREAILAIAARYGASNVRVFGSSARGDAGPDSDVDFLIDLDRPWSLMDRIAMKHDLEDLLGCEVDLAVASHLREIIREEVLREAVAL